MSSNKHFQTPALAYAALLHTYWGEAPGVASERQKASEARLLTYLSDPDRIDSAAVAMGSVADEEMLLAENFLGQGKSVQAWEVLDSAQAHGQLMDEVLDYLVWRPENYATMISRFSTFAARFALALARSNDRDIRWYAQQVYNLGQSGLADESCQAIEYVELYYTMAVSALTGKWPEEDQLDDRLGVYRELFLSAGDAAGMQDALLECAKYHLDLAAYIAPRNEVDSSHPFRTRYTTLFAFELLGWVGLYKRLKGAISFEITHPMLPPTLFNPPAQQSVSDANIVKLRELARLKFGDTFQSELPPKFEHS